ncbi:unnamed protein product [Ixodes persulcatus]
MKGKRHFSLSQAKYEDVYGACSNLTYIGAPRKAGEEKLDQEETTEPTLRRLKNRTTAKQEEAERVNLLISIKIPPKNSSTSVSFPKSQTVFPIGRAQLVPIGNTQLGFDNWNQLIFSMRSPKSQTVFPIGSNCQKPIGPNGHF